MSIREAAVNGTFYPATCKEINDQLSYFNNLLNRAASMNRRLHADLTPSSSHMPDMFTVDLPRMLRIKAVG